MTLSSIESKDRDSKRSMIPALVFKDQYKVIFVLATLKRGDKCLTGTTRRRLNFSSKKSFKRVTYYFCLTTTALLFSGLGFVSQSDEMKLNNLNGIC